MGINTLTEFVESAEILRKLQSLGIDYVQGYGIAKPLSIDGIAPIPARLKDIVQSQQETI